jgi:hypothetical protein
MELADAWDRVQRILMEERARPTVEYYGRIYELQKENKPWNEELHDLLKRWNKLYMNPRLVLSRDRDFRPRHIHEFPGEYIFRSENFNLLTIVYGELSKEDRAQLMSILMQLLSSHNSFRKSEHKNPFPSFRNNVSEFPLIAEFVVRHGHANDLFEALSTLAAPTIPLAILFKCSDPSSLHSALGACAGSMDAAPQADILPGKQIQGATREYSRRRSGSERRLTQNAAGCVTKGCKRVSSRWSAVPLCRNHLHAEGPTFS